MSTGLINVESISYEDILNDIRTYVRAKPEYARWKSFYEIATGTTIEELFAAVATYIAYHNLIARRENYMMDALIRSSVVANAQDKGYPVFRGKNAHLYLTVMPDQTISFNKFDIVGSVSGYDLVAFEDVALEFEVPKSFEIVMGNIETEEQVIPSRNINTFRFIKPKVSEDFILYVNDNEVPTDNFILKLTEDKYIVLTNSLNSVDVLYLNKYPPDLWVSNSSYSESEYITPNFSWRASTIYKINDQVVPTVSNGYRYKVIAKVSGSNTTEPIWPETLGATVVDGGITWENVGLEFTNLYYRSTTVGIANSGTNEPIWSMDVGTEIVDNEITWVCTNENIYSLYPYDTNDVLKIAYIQLEDIQFSPSALSFFYGEITNYISLNEYAEPEDIDSIKINAPLFHETKKLIRGRNDYKKILREILANVTATNGHDISPAVVELTYVKDHTTNLWYPNMYVDSGQYVMPSIPNNFIYQADVSAYTTTDTKGNSGASEPIWPIIIGETIQDGEVIWRCENQLGLPPTWQPVFEYKLQEVVLPISSNGFQYRAIRFDIEPVWPTVIGATVVEKSGSITWTCIESIFLEGYDATYRRNDTYYAINSFVLPLLETGFFYKALSSGTTGTLTPTFPTVIGETVIDGGVTWQCYDLVDADEYQINNALTELKTYRPFGVEPPTMAHPKIVWISLAITIYINSNVSLIQISEDVDSILEVYERIPQNKANLQDIEHAIERLDYVNIARVVLDDENKSKVWQMGTEYNVTDILYPPIANGFVYEVAYAKFGKETGYSQWNDKGYSATIEPLWPVNLGDEIVERDLLRWKAEIETIPMPSTWSTDTLYSIDDVVIPTTPNGFQYRLVNIEYTEPNWPLEVNQIVENGELFLRTYDPTNFIPSLTWNEYYIFKRTITRILNK